MLSDYVNGGFMVFDKRVFKYIKKGETEHPALVRLSKIKQLSLYNHNGLWKSVDTYKELENLNKIWKEHAPWKVWI